MKNKTTPAAATTTIHQVLSRYSLRTTSSSKHQLLCKSRCRRNAQGWSRTTRLPMGMTIVRAVSAPESFTAWDTATQRVEKRDDIKTIMLLGAGPIVIGQVCCRSCEMHERG